MNKIGAKKVFFGVFTTISVLVLAFCVSTRETKAFDDGISIKEISKTANEIVVEVQVDFVDESYWASEGISNLGCDIGIYIKKGAEDYEESEGFLHGHHCDKENTWPIVAQIKISNLQPSTTYELKPNLEAVRVGFFADEDLFDDPETISITTNTGAGGGGDYDFSLVEASLGNYSNAFKGSFIEEISQTGFGEGLATPGVSVSLSPTLDSEKGEGDYPVSFDLVACEDIAFNAIGTICESAFEDKAFVMALYKTIGGEKVSEAEIMTPSNDDLLPEEYNQLGFNSLDFGTSYTAKMYYKADKGGDEGGIDLFDSSDKEYYEIASLTFTTMPETALDEFGYGYTETGNAPDYEPPQQATYYGNWLDIKCKLQPSTWAGCAVLWFHSLIYTPAQGILYIGALFTDSMLSFSISSVIYRNATFAETGWQIIRDIANLFFIIILVYVAIGTILGSQKGSVQKIITQLIVIALLINFSLFFTRIIVDASNILARVFYNTLTIEGKQETPVVKNTGVEYKSLSRAIADGLDVEKSINPDVVGGDSNDNLGTVFVMLLFGVFLCLYAAWEFFLIGFMFLQRIMEIWISMIFAPFAFISTIIPTWGKMFDRAGWDRWLKNLLCWCFIAPIFLFFIMLIAAFINSDFLQGMLVAKEEGNLNLWQYWVALLMQFMIIMGLVKMVRQIAKSLGCESANQFVDLGSKWTKRIGFGAGALALGVVAGAGAAAGRNTLGRLGAQAADSEALKMKARQRGFSGWVARKQLGAATNLSKASFDVRKTAAGNQLEKFGFKEKGVVGQATSLLGFNQKQTEEGYKQRKEKRKKKELDFYKEMALDKKGYDKLTAKYNAGLQEHLKNNQAEFGYKGENLDDFKKNNPDAYKKAQEEFNRYRDNEMYSEYYDKYKKKNGIESGKKLTEEQKKEALDVVRKDKLETTKAVFEKANGTDRKLEDINKDRLNSFAESIDKKNGYIMEAIAKASGNAGAGGVVIGAAGGASILGTGTAAAFAGLPILEARSKRDAYKAAADELREMANNQGKDKKTRETNEKKIKKEQQYQDKMVKLLENWKNSVDDYNTKTKKEEMKITLEGLKEKDGEVILDMDSDKFEEDLEKVMEMNDRKIAEHELKRDALSERARTLRKSGKELSDDEHDEFVKAAAEIKKLQKENNDIDNFTKNHKNSQDRLDRLRNQENNRTKPPVEEKKDAGKKDDEKK